MFNSTPVFESGKQNWPSHIYFYWRTRRDNVLYYFRVITEKLLTKSPTQKIKIFFIFKCFNVLWGISLLNPLTKRQPLKQYSLSDILTCLPKLRNKFGAPISYPHPTFPLLLICISISECIWSISISTFSY